MTIQAIYDANRNNVLRLEPGEYAGPLKITRTGTIDGGGATLWAERGPALVVASRSVTIKNLSVEITGANGGQETAIKTTAPDTRLENVRVLGQLDGFAAETGRWDMPSAIALGAFAAGAENSFAVEITAGATAKTKSLIKGLTVCPAEIPAGRQMLRLVAEPLAAGTYLYGQLEIVSPCATRQIIITGQAKSGALIRRAAVPKPIAPTAVPASALPPPPPPGSIQPPANPAPTDAICPAAPSAASPAPPPPASISAAPAPLSSLQKGQRLDIPPAEEITLRLKFSGWRRKFADIDVDAYAFLLDKAGKVRGDDDFIFFSQAQSADGAASVGKNGGQPFASVSLSKAAPAVEKIAVCFAIYSESDDPRAAERNFSLLDAPFVEISVNDAPRYQLPLADLSAERSFVAGEFYRYKGAWKFRVIGMGYRDGIDRLCREYGVDVEG